jgi:hypothetical protein
MNGTDVAFSRMLRVAGLLPTAAAGITDAAMTPVTQGREGAGSGSDPIVVFRAPADLIDAIRRTARAERLTLSELVRRTMRQRVGLQPSMNEAPHPREASNHAGKVDQPRSYIRGTG